MGAVLRKPYRGLCEAPSERETSEKPWLTNSPRVGPDVGAVLIASRLICPDAEAIQTRVGQLELYIL